MASVNTTVKATKIFTHEGGSATKIDDRKQLQRLVATSLLWEKGFYVDGQTVESQIAALVEKLPSAFVAEVAIKAREESKLRHMPLYLVREMARHKKHAPFVAATLARVIQRADELTEYLAIYGREPISKQSKIGLALAFKKFNEYALQKYNRTQKEVTLANVLKLVHPMPDNDAQSDLWKRLLADELETPRTWEVLLSAGDNKKATFEALINEGKLGGLAMLRNIRGMVAANVNKNIIRKGINEMAVERVLPYQFITAARYGKDFEPELETAMFKCLAEMPKLTGRTGLLVDISGSMSDKLSAKSELTRLDAARGLAMLLREICESVTIATFDTQTYLLPARRGFALADLMRTQGGTNIWQAVQAIERHEKLDRLIVITDEQTMGNREKPQTNLAYMINVANYRNGVSYSHGWEHIDGWSEHVIRYIQEKELTNS